MSIVFKLKLILIRPSKLYLDREGGKEKFSLF